MTTTSHPTTHQGPAKARVRPAVAAGASRAALALAMLGLAAQAQAQAQTSIFLPAPAPQPSRCGGTTGTSTFGSAISADGTVVLGGSDVRPGCIVVLRWRGGVPVAVEGVNTIPAGLALRRISGASGDGQIFTIDTFLPADDPNFPFGTRDSYRARYWTPTTLFQAFPDLSATEVIYEANGVSTDGRFFAVNSGNLEPDLLNGTGLFGLGNNRKALRWSSAGGYEDIGRLAPGGSISANGISGDGNIIVGQDFVPNTIGATRSRSAGFRWQSGVGIAQLPDLSTAPRSGTLAPSTTAYGISRDGSTIFGQSRGADGFNQAVIWRGGTVTGLGFVQGYAPTDIFFGSINATVPSAASANGAVIGGFIPTADGSRAWRWTAASGIQDLNLLATNAGIVLNGFVLTDVGGISDNGQFITGASFNTTLNQQLGYLLQLTQVTQSRLVVTLRLPGVTQTSIVNQTFNTQVDGLLNGRNVFTRTVTDPITGAAGLTALADARAALQLGGGLRRVVIGAPVLVSNITTVLGTTSNTVDVASGTTTSTATVNSFGPGTVATGNLGTCATPAANNANPTGCSLPGTPVAVDVGITNANVFTNTINSVTPTTTASVNQLVTARWQVSATAGNQFGTVHALVGPAAFDRGDRLVGQLIGLGAGGLGGSSLARSEVGKRGWTMFGGYFGNWSSIDADTRVPVARVTGNANGFVLGLEKRLDAVRLGAAVDYGTSDYRVQDAQYPETLSFRHTQIALFAGWNSGGFSLDGAASYGFGTARTSLTTPTTPASGERDVRSWSLGAQAGYAVPLGKRASAALIGGVRHISAELGRFTETGGPTPLAGIAQTVSRTRLFAGVEAQAGLDAGGVTITPRLHARYAHDSGAASGTADLVFAGTPNGPVMQAIGPGVGRNVVELGGGLDAQLSARVHLWASYDGAFRSGSRTHAARAGLTVNW